MSKHNTIKNINGKDCTRETYLQKKPQQMGNATEHRLSLITYHHTLLQPYTVHTIYTILLTSHRMQPRHTHINRHVITAHNEWLKYMSC